MEISSPSSQTHAFSKNTENGVSSHLDPSPAGYEKFVMSGDVMIQVKSTSPVNLQESPASDLLGNHSNTGVTTGYSLPNNSDERTHESNHSSNQLQHTNGLSHISPTNASGHYHIPTNMSSHDHITPPSTSLNSANITSSEAGENYSATSRTVKEDARVPVVGFGSDSLDPSAVKVDEPSAQRLAKRLYNLDGFKRSDVAYHLTRDNHFSRKVNEEYLKYFDFTDLNLLDAMRRFFEHFALVGETQERERVLNHFTHRYIQCNPSTLHTVYQSQDSCHTLTCAIMLLNTDLHGMNLRKRMTQAEFTENLSGLNGPQDFPKDLLKFYFMSIKQSPLAWATDEVEGETKTNELTNAAENGAVFGPPPQHSSLSPSFLDIPAHQDAIEYQKGNLQKKHCNGPDLRPVASGKRGWKDHYVILKGMALYLLKSSESQIEEKTTKFILLHHSLAQVARSYKRKPCVFSLQTADWSEYLFSASNVDELRSWVNMINMASALLSAEPLAAGVGSQKKFHRPLLPSSPTNFTLNEQFKSHEQRLKQIRNDVAEEESCRPDIKSASKQAIANYNEKTAFLKYELQRYMIYASLLRDKLDQEAGSGPTAIGEEDETNVGSTPSEKQIPNLQQAALPPQYRRTGTKSDIAASSRLYDHPFNSEEEVFV